MTKLKKDTMENVPTYDSMFEAVLTAINELGGSGSNQEIYEKVSENENISDAVLDVLHNDGPMTKVEYRLRWTQTYLKKYGAITNTKKGIWTLLPRGRDMSVKDIATIHARVREKMKLERKVKKKHSNEAEQDIDTELAWNVDLLNVLKKIDPTAFERLCQRILRESGFTKVQVTGKSNDGGIDGVGILRMELVSFQVIFQCKRYKNSVSSPAIRDFRGAMTGRADKGIFMTTATFTAEAKREATRDGAPTIDLIDGDALCDLMKKLRLGVNIEMVEKVSIDKSFFENF